MLIVQVVTAPIQILLNGIPGSKAFSGWLKKTASYLIPYPVVAAMFLFAAILIGPSRGTSVFALVDSRDDNPFSVNESSPLYSEGGNVWIPPFTLPNAKIPAAELYAIIGFAIVLMTPAAAKMAQDWLQVKESPYASEVGGAFSGAWGMAQLPIGAVKDIRRQAEQRQLMQDQATWIGRAVSKDKVANPPGK